MSFTKAGVMGVAAHRGDSYNYPENTMLAFEKAIEAGADMLETDVRMSADGVLVLMHDPKVDRTTDGRGIVREMKAEEIAALNAGDALCPQRVPLFEEVLALAARRSVALNIEIKEYREEGNGDRWMECTDKVLALVEQYGMAERILINSFDAPVLEYVYSKHGKRYKLHGFYPYSAMIHVGIDPDEYLFCACLCKVRDPKLYDDLIRKGIEPWIGAGVTRESELELCCRYGARLITANAPGDALEKLGRLGRRDG